MPSAAVALGDGGHPAHCLTDEQLGLPHQHQHDDGPGHVGAHAHGQPLVHLHEDGTVHRHTNASRQSGPSDRDGGAGACCGLFGLTALAVDPQLDLGPPSRHASIFSMSFEELSGRGPDRINRPPIAVLPL